MINKDINPFYIRNNTIKKMRKHRERFMRKVQEIYQKEGIKRRFKDDEWDKIFVNKMWLVQDIKNLKDL